jgi:DNA-binding transcriptional ArsR family regulator
VNARAEVRAVLTDEGLTLSTPARAVLMALAVFADREGRAWPSVPTLSTTTGLHPGTVRRALTELAEAGLVTAPRGRSGGRASTRWHIHPAQGTRGEPRAGDAPSGSNPRSPRVNPRGGRAEGGRTSIDEKSDDNTTGAPPSPLAVAPEQRQANIAGVHTLREQLRGAS